MGWTGSMQRFSSKLDAACVMEGFKREDIVASNVDGDAVFLAVRMQNGQIDGYVCIVETSQRDGEVETFTKAMHESMGPYRWGASARVLDALTPTEEPTANGWRASCRHDLNRRLAARDFARLLTPGMTVSLKRDVSFADGSVLRSGSHVRVVEVKRTAVTLADSFRFKLKITGIGEYLEIPTDRYVVVVRTTDGDRRVEPVDRSIREAEAIRDSMADLAVRKGWALTYRVEPMASAASLRVVGR